MSVLSLTFLTLTLAWYDLPSVLSTTYTMRSGQRLAYNPLLTFSTGLSSLGRCLMACRSKAGCSSVNVQLDESTSQMTCELLDVYLNEAASSLMSASGWTFIQEDPLYTDSWALVFRASSAVGLSVWDTWHQDGRHDDPVQMEGCVNPASSLPCTTHYRSYILDKWSNIDQVLITVYKDAAVVAQVTFDGQNSDRRSWMTLSRIVNSTWSDLTSTGTSNWLNMEGMPVIYRRFYMSAYHANCDGDGGWMMVADWYPDTYVDGLCSWETTQPVLPTILFSPTSTAVLMSSLDIADFMMVHVTFLD